MKRDSNVMGIDIAKRVFHVIGMATRGPIIVRKRFYRGEVRSLIAQMPRAVVVIDGSITPWVCPCSPGPCGWPWSGCSSRWLWPCS